MFKNNFYKITLISTVFLIFLIPVSLALPKVYLNDSAQFTISGGSLNKTFPLSSNLTIDDDINHSFEGRSSANNGDWDVAYIASNTTGFLLRFRIDDESVNGPTVDDKIQQVDCITGALTTICDNGCGGNNFNNFHNFTVQFNSTSLTARIFIDGINRADINVCTNATKIGSINFSRQVGSAEIKNNLLLSTNLNPILIGSLPNITWPEDTSSSFNISGNFSDPNNDTLTYSILSPVNNISITINSSTGIVNLTPSLNFNGIRYVIFFANDSENITYSNNVTLNVTPVNDIPTISNITLNNTDFLNRTNGSLVAGWTFNDVDGDLQQNNQTRWYINGTEKIEFRNFTLINSTNTTKNQNWTFSVSVYDGTNWSEFANSTSMVIQGLPPTVSNAILINTDFLNRTNGTLNSNWTQFDFDNNPLSNRTRWYTNGIENESFRNQTSIAYQNTTKNQTWIFSVQVFNVDDASDFANSSSITINNAVPTQSIPIITSNDDQNRKNGTLTCSNQSTSDLDIDVITNFIKWFNNGVLTNSSINSATLNAGNYSKTDNITCEITPFDGTVNGTAMNSTNFTILNAAPLLNKTIPDKSWNKDTPETINLVNGFVDIDNDNLTYNYSDVSNIVISINNQTGTATLNPSSGFTGTRNIVFYAFDGTNQTSSNNITLTINEVTQSSSSSSSSGSTGGGGGGGGSSGYQCSFIWKCDEWSGCTNEEQSRNCKLVQVPDFFVLDRCPQFTIPEQSRACAVSAEKEESCDDGIKNQNEAEIDCGGACKPCETQLNETATEQKQSQNTITGAVIGKNNGFNLSNLWLVLAVALMLGALVLYAGFSHKRIFRKEQLSEKEMQHLNDMLNYKIFKK